MCRAQVDRQALLRRTKVILLPLHRRLSNTSAAQLHCSHLTFCWSSLGSSCGDSRAERAWRPLTEDSSRLSISVSPTLLHSREKALWLWVQHHKHRHKGLSLLAVMATCEVYGERNLAVGWGPGVQRCVRSVSKERTRVLKVTAVYSQLCHSRSCFFWSC